MMMYPDHGQKFCYGHDIFGRGVNRGGDRCSLQKAEEESELRSGGGCDSESSNFILKPYFLVSLKLELVAFNHHITFCQILLSDNLYLL